RAVARVVRRRVRAGRAVRGGRAVLGGERRARGVRGAVVPAPALVRRVRGVPPRGGVRHAAAHRHERQARDDLMTTLLLVRHGLTAMTGPVLAGWTPDVNLNDAGRAQAEAVAARLAPVPVSA